MLQQRRFCNVVQRFHRNYMTTSERRYVVTSQQRCNDVFGSTGLKISLIPVSQMTYCNLQNLTLEVWKLAQIYNFWTG